MDLDKAIKFLGMGAATMTYVSKIGDFSQADWDSYCDEMIKANSGVKPFANALRNLVHSITKVELPEEKADESIDDFLRKATDGLSAN